MSREIGDGRWQAEAPGRRPGGRLHTTFRDRRGLPGDAQSTARRRVLAIVDEREFTVVALGWGEVLSTHRIEPDHGYRRTQRRDMAPRGSWGPEDNALTTHSPGAQRRLERKQRARSGQWWESSYRSSHPVVASPLDLNLLTG